MAAMFGLSLICCSLGFCYPGVAAVLSIALEHAKSPAGAPGWASGLREVRSLP